MIRVSKKRGTQMITRKVFAAAVLIIALMAGNQWGPLVASAASIEVPRISVEQTKQMLAIPDVVIIDVRTAKTWWRSPNKIENAVREEPGSLEHWAEKYPKDKTLIFYCT
jgi:hypothetical protein